MSRTYGKSLLGTNDNAPRTKYASAGNYSWRTGKEMKQIQATNMFTMQEEAEPKEPSQTRVNVIRHTTCEICATHPVQ